MPSREEIVRRAHDALNEGDVETLVALCDPSFRLDMSDRVLNPAVFEGHDGIRRFYSEVMEVWEEFTWTPTELREEGGATVVLLRARGKGRGSGLEIDRRCAMLWRVDAGRARSLTFYRDPEEAIAAASEAPAQTS